MTTQRKNVCGMFINPVAAKAYTITNAYCVSCGKRGSDKCRECREREKNRIAELDKMPPRGGLREH